LVCFTTLNNVCYERRHLPIAEKFMPVEDTSSLSVSIVLNAHLPYVLPYSHWPQGASWLFRTAAETYLPILHMLDRLVDEGRSPRLTIAFSPVLCEMLSDLEFSTQFSKYLQERIVAANTNKRQFAAHGLEHLSNNALSWEGWYTDLERDFEERYARDILGAFRRLQDDGHLEIIATPATQAVLTRLATREAIAAQVRLGVESHKKYFGRAPQGIWLPAPVANGEVYTPELIESLLAQHGLKYFVPAMPSQLGDDGSRFYTEKLRLQGLTSAAISDASYSHPAALPLRPELSRRVWSSADGFAGDGYFLDFDRQHYPGGLSYWRRTARDANPAQTEPYEPAQVGPVCDAHAENWLTLLQQSNASQPIGVAMDAHALGRWWLEGHNWLRRVLRKAAAHDITLVTASEAMQQVSTTPTTQELQPISELWSHPDNAWVWEEVAQCEKEIVALARRHREVYNPKLREVLDQCARELLLMQDATWPLMLAGSENRTLAAQRIGAHIEIFECLVAIADLVAGGEFMSEGSRAFLDDVQERDRIFPDIAYNTWANEI
jgi:1,4-alpha-glucan branching enzyme